MTIEYVPPQPELIEKEQNGALAGALAKAQSSFPPIPREKEVRVTTRTGGSYTFKYAPLDFILGAVRKPLADNGLAITQLLDGGDLVTALLHKDGGRLIGRVPLPRSDGDTVQALGSAITYLRRYSIQAILGIAAEEDDDGNRASGNTATPAGEGTRPPVIEPNVETEELVGIIERGGTVRPGTANGYKLEARQGPTGHVIGFRLEIDGDKNIPQVVVEGPAGDALFLATSQNPESLIGHRIDVKGRLNQVRRPGTRGYYRLHVTEWRTKDYRYPAEELPARSVAPVGSDEPPDDVPLVGEATAPLFDDVA